LSEAFRRVTRSGTCL